MTTSCSRWAVGWASCRSSSPRASHTCTSWRSTARSRRRSARRSRRSRTPRSTWPTRSGWISPIGARSEQGRCEPALWRCGDGAAQVRRRAAGRGALGRDGPARGGRPAGRGARRQELRGDLGAGAARLRGPRPAEGPADGLPPGAERRLGARRAPSPWAGPAGGARGARARRVRAPAQGARRIAGADAGRARRHPRRAPRGARAASATRPTPVPSDCRPAIGRGWPRRWAASASPACDRGSPTLNRCLASSRTPSSTSSCTWVLAARMGCTPCAPSLPRSTWRTR